MVVGVGEEFPKRVRLRRQADFDAVYRAETYAADDVLVVQARQNGLNVTRLGLSVSKRVGNAATRNRWKRTIREVFRKCRHNLPVGMDLIFRPKKGATLSYAAVQRSLPRLVSRVDKRIQSGKR